METIQTGIKFPISYIKRDATEAKFDDLAELGQYFEMLGDCDISYDDGYFLDASRAHLRIVVEATLPVLAIPVSKPTWEAQVSYASSREDDRVLIQESWNGSPARWLRFRGDWITGAGHYESSDQSDDPGTRGVSRPEFPAEGFDRAWRRTRFLDARKSDDARVRIPRALKRATRG